MSIGIVNNSAAGNLNLASRALATRPSRVTEPWKANPSWPVIAVPSSSEQKLIGLHAVFPGDGSGNGGNFLAVNCAGAYTVNYGDGTVTNYATGVQANYEFNFNSASLAGTNAPVTLVDSGDLVQRTAHGYSNGDTVQFFNIVSTTGLTEAARYFVINSTADSFQVSTAVGGSAVILTTNGSATLLPYKIAIVTITPQAGQNLTSINLNLRNPSANLALYTSGWLDLAIAAPQLTTLTLGLLASVLNWDLTQRFRCSSLGTVSTLASAFFQWRGLESASLEGIGSVLDMTRMFYLCHSLTYVSLLDTAAVTTVTQMFYLCYSLPTVSLFNTAAVTNMVEMFNGCPSLTTVPLFNTAVVTNMSNMFQSCSSLTTVPLFNTAAVTNMQSMFAGCSSLTTVPLFNTAAVTNMSSMFNNCYSLTTVPAFTQTAITSGGANFMCSNSSNLSRFRATGVRFSIGFSGCKLSAAALNEIFTNLGTASGQTITITNNYGAATCTRSIATAKGWTVTG